MTLNTDACNEQIGDILLQMQSDHMTKPIGYQSRSLTNTEQRYNTTQRECLAIVWPKLLLQPNLESQQCTIRTPLDGLNWILNPANSTIRIARWCPCLSEFDFDVIHCAVVKNQAANMLSRLSTSGNDNSSLEAELPLVAIDYVMSARISDISDHCSKNHIVNSDNTEANTGKLVHNSPTLVQHVYSQLFLLNGSRSGMPH